MKITAIHGGGDWSDASADYLILPEGMDFEQEKAARERWYWEEYLSALQCGDKPEFLSMVGWLRKRGAVDPTDEHLTVVHE